MLSFDPKDRLFERWSGYSDFECFPCIDVDMGVEIIQEMERCEPFQHNRSIYHDDYKRWGFIKELLKEARKRYEITMARALQHYFK